jgi:hypothetical protein
MNNYFNYIVIIVLVLLFLILSFNKETYSTGFGVGRSFREYIHPRPCLPKNNCFKGAYFRSAVYQNMCEPKNTNLLREPVQLQDNCVRTLDADVTSSNYKFVCCVNKHMQRKCKWVPINKK